MKTVRKPRKAKVLKLALSGFTAQSNADMATKLRCTADAIENGGYGGSVRQLVAVIEREDGQLEQIVLGGPCDHARMMGLLVLGLIRSS